MLNVLIGAGHSGVINGLYFTPGKRSPHKKTPEDKGIFEGEFNRAVASYLWAKCEVDDNMFGELINPGPVPISTKTKIGFINWYHKIYPNTIYIEIHANAISNDWQYRADGFAVFHDNDPNVATSRLARYVERHMRIEPLLQIVTRGIKTARQIGRGSFSMLEKTRCPALIVECGFMDNPNEVELLKMPRVQRLLAGGIHAGIGACNSSTIGGIGG